MAARGSNLGFPTNIEGRVEAVPGHDAEPDSIVERLAAEVVRLEDAVVDVDIHARRVSYELDDESPSLNPMRSAAFEVDTQHGRPAVTFRGDIAGIWVWTIAFASWLFFAAVASATTTLAALDPPQRFGYAALLGVVLGGMSVMYWWSGLRTWPRRVAKTALLETQRPPDRQTGNH